jgi:hypothetical protein
MIEIKLYVKNHYEWVRAEFLGHGMAETEEGEGISGIICRTEDGDMHCWPVDMVRDKGNEIPCIPLYDAVERVINMERVISNIRTLCHNFRDQAHGANQWSKEVLQAVLSECDG